MTEKKTAPSGGSESENDTRATASKATDELAEAARHLKHAAQILFAKAAKDPTLRNAAEDAEKLLDKVGATAEPLAKQLAGELGKLGRSIVQNLEGKKKDESRPAPTDEKAGPGDAAKPE